MPRSAGRTWPAWSGHVDLALGDSEFNRQELERLGFAPTGVLPIALDLERITRAPAHPVLEQLLGDGLTNFLFVGRIVPNKRVEDIVRLAEVYKRYIDANYRFIFVGRTDGMPRYYATVRALVAEFDMLPERFVFAGRGAGLGAGGLLPDRQRLPVAERARGVLRAAARGDGGRRAGLRL